MHAGQMPCRLHGLVGHCGGHHGCMKDGGRINDKKKRAPRLVDASLSKWIVIGTLRGSNETLRSALPSACTDMCSNLIA